MSPEVSPLPSVSTGPWLALRGNRGEELEHDWGLRWAYDNEIAAFESTTASFVVTTDETIFHCCSASAATIDELVCSVSVMFNLKVFSGNVQEPCSIGHVEIVVR